MAKLVRIARNGDSVIAKTDTGYVVVSSSDASVLSTAETLAEALSTGTWRRPLEKDTIALEAIVSSLSLPKVAERRMRLPKKVQEGLSVMLASAVLSEEDTIRLSNIVKSGTATASDASWLTSLQQQTASKLSAFSDEGVSDWADKVGNDEVVSSFEPSDSLQYFVAGDDEDSTFIDTLVAVADDDTLLTWANDQFIEMPDTLEDYDRDFITQVGPEDARIVADWISAGKPGGVMDIMETSPDEAALFAAAEGALDLDFMDVLTAAGGYRNYTPEERRTNAKKQRRNNQGKFAPSGRGRIEKPKRKKKGSMLFRDKQNTPVAKLSRDKYTPFEQSRAWHYWHRARLRKYLPTILEEKKDITQWLKDNRALWDMRSYRPKPLRAAGEVEENVDVESTEGGIGTDGIVGVYFAVVDDVDHAAVLDLIAIKDDGNGNPASWVRRGSQWINDQALLAELKSSTPPPVVRIDDADEVKEIIRQVDAYDTKNGVKNPGDTPTSEPDVEPTAEPVADEDAAATIKDAERGYALPDGSMSIHDGSDLSDALTAFSALPVAEQAGARRHIRKRARAINRNDLLPSEWKTTEQSDFFEELNIQSEALYGPFGEVLVASGVPGVADTPKDFEAVRRLKNYWTKGPGAAKIMWQNPEGNMTRCIALLSKYMPGRAAGYCQELHKEVYGGKTNHEVDKAAGL